MFDDKTWRTIQEQKEMLNTACMGGKMEGVHISCDTYWEKCFYHACTENSLKMKIFYEWQNHKERYTKKTALIAHDFPHYSVHGQEHSRTIIEAVEMFLGKWRVERLGIGDLWLFLNAAYGHDVGMVIQNEEVVRLWKQDQDFHDYIHNLARNPESDMQDAVNYYMQLHNILNAKPQMEGVDGLARIYELTDDWPVIIKRNVILITADYIRRHHHARSKRFFDNFSEAIGVNIAENRIYRILGKVCYAHGCDLKYIKDELPLETDGFGNEKIHPQFIAMLLRLGDLLDMDNNRFDIDLLNHFGKLPVTSALHFKKHLAVSHLLITERTIEAVEQVEDLDTCKVVGAWFRYIESGVLEITSNWNLVAPKKLEGCTFQTCNLQIYFNGNRYEDVLRHHFEVDNRKFMEVLIGDKLYEDELVFLREYLQNAIDATKLMIWIKAKGGENGRIFPGAEYESCEEKPIELNTMYLDDMSIRLELELVLGESEENKGKEYIRFRIKDHGIGMDEECLKALTIIGTGWSGRKKYIEEIGSMPDWLKPTGGFGIGIQSGFMMADKIQIKTKGLRGRHGYEIEMYSPQKSGEVNYWISDYEIVGTEVILDVEFGMLLKKLQESKLFEISSEKEVLQNSGVFDYEDILDVVRDYIVNFIGKMIPNSFIPIHIAIRKKNLPKMAEVTIGSGIYDYIKQNHRPKATDGWCECVLSENLNSCYFWIPEGMVYVGIKNMMEYRNGEPDQICFKGVAVKEKDVRSEDRLISRFVPVMIDVMGMRASDCLLISRSHFKESMSREFRNWSRRCFSLYIKVLAKELLTGLEQDNITDIPETKLQLINHYQHQFLLLLMGALRFGKNSDMEQLCQKYTPNFEYQVEYFQRNEGGEERLVFGTVSYWSLYSLLAEKSDLIMWSAQEDDDRRTMLNLDIKNIKQDNERDFVGFDVRRNNIRACVEHAICQMHKNVDKDRYFLITDVKIRNILEEFFSDNMGSFCVQNMDRDPKSVLVHYFKPKMEQEVHKEESVDRRLETAIERKYYYILVEEEYAEKYSNLYVDSVPISVGLNPEFLNANHIILLPFNKHFYAMLDEKQKKGQLTWEEFWRMLTDNPAWKRAIEWTLHHNKNKKVFIRRENVTKQYEKLCRAFYDAFMRKRVKM